MQWLLLHVSCDSYYLEKGKLSVLFLSSWFFWSFVSKSWNNLPVCLPLVPFCGGWLAAVSDRTASQLLINYFVWDSLGASHQASISDENWFLDGMYVLMALVSVCVGPGSCCHGRPAPRVLGGGDGLLCATDWQRQAQKQESFSQGPVTLPGSIVSDCSLVHYIK